MDIARALKEVAISGVRENYPLKEATTYKIGGPAEFFIETGFVSEIAAIVKFCALRGVPLTVLGAGSNVLAPDEGVSGVCLRVYDASANPSIENESIVSSGAVTDKSLAEFVAERGISGFEFLYDIPGTVGGAIVQNAGMNEHEVKNGILEATIVNKKGEAVVFSGEEHRLGYRTSRLKEEWGIIVEAKFRIDLRDDPSAIFGRMKELKETRAGKFPMEYPNCGSVFKRPTGYYAGKLIQDAGLGGASVGGAMVSPKHRNFIVNTGGATASDIKLLVERIISEVYAKFGVRLERELIYLESFPPPP